MAIKDIILDLSKIFNYGKVNNKNSHNINNSSDVVIQGNNYGYEYTGGDKVIQNNNGFTVNNIYINNKSDENITKVSLRNELARIKKIPNNSHSLVALDEYKKLILLNPRGSITDDEYYKILLNILYIHLNRNEIEEVNLYLEQIEALGYKYKKELIIAKAIMNFNETNFSLAYELIKDIDIKKDESLEYMLKKSLECINNIISYDEYKMCVLNEKNDLILLNEEFESANLYTIIAYTAKAIKEYDDLIYFSLKAYEISNEVEYKLKLAYSYYYYGIKDSINGNLVTQDRINYQKIIEAKNLAYEVVEYSKLHTEELLYESAIDLYINTLSILGEVGKVINSITRLGFFKKNESFLEIENRLKYIYEDSTNETIDSISESDIFLKNILKLLKEKEYITVISMIEPKCWNKYIDDYKFHCILLECYLENDELCKFINHLKRIEDLEVESNLIIKTKAKYYLHINENCKAEKLLLESINKYRDPESYLLLLKLYNKANLNDKFESFINNILQVDRFVLDVMYKEIYRMYFEFLYKNNNYIKAKEILNDCEEDRYGTENYLKESCNINSKLGNYIISAEALENLYECTKRSEYLFDAACEYLRGNKLSIAKKILLKLEKQSVDYIEKIYVLLSNIEVLNGDLDKAYTYASKAKEKVIDIPKSEIHNFYVSRSLRCNRTDDSVRHMTSFMESYPKINTWVKAIKVTENDENGNEVLAREIKDFIKENSESFNTIIDLLRNKRIGISNICYRGKYYINEVFQWRNIYRINININSGNTEKLNNELQYNCDNIMLDIIGLYVLADIDELEILKSFKYVYITMSTIEYINHMLLRNEDSNLRNILKFIDTNLNIKIVGINNKNYSCINEEINNLFDDYILDTLIYSKINNITYCYGESIIDLCAKFDGYTGISIVALINNLEDEIKARIIGKLKINKYDFINFNYKDMYIVAKNNNFIIDKEIESLFEVDKSGDINTFIIQYIIFISAIYYKKREYFDSYLKLFLKAINSLFKRSLYAVSISNSIIKNEYGQLDNIEKYKYIINNPDYIRGITMRQCASYALRSIYYLFNDEKEFEYYFNIIKVNVCEDLIKESLKNKLKEEYIEGIKARIQML